MPGDQRPWVALGLEYWGEVCVGAEWPQVSGLVVKYDEDKGGLQGLLSSKTLGRRQ